MIVPGAGHSGDDPKITVCGTALMLLFDCESGVM